MTRFWLLLGGGGTALLLALGLTAILIRIAARVGFVDRPGGHKSHEQPTPYGGGVAIFLAAALPLIAAVVFALVASEDWVVRTFGEPVRAYLGGVRERGPVAATILGGGLVLHVLGLLDDRRPLGAFAKLVAIGGVALLTAVVAGIRAAEFAGPVVATTVTVIWIVIVTNTFNFLDNMDGLSAGVAAICTTFLIVCGTMAGQVLVPALGCVLLGAVGGFLAFNFPPARVFMGDAGSLFIGYMLAVLSVLTTYYESGAGMPPYALAMPLVVLAVPLYDFVSVVVIRVVEGRNPMAGDQRHFSHRLVDRGLSRRYAVVTIYIATAATGLCATLLPGASLGQTLTIGVIVLLVLAIVAILEMPLRKQS